MVRDKMNKGDDILTSYTYAFPTRKQLLFSLLPILIVDNDEVQL